MEACGNHLVPPIRASKVVAKDIEDQSGDKGEGMHPKSKMSLDTADQDSYCVICMSEPRQCGGGAPLQSLLLLFAVRSFELY